jgi:L-threonylcarbamoyladenylate synthase
MLHQLDRSGFKTIAVMNVPETGLGLAINDRLRRAAGAQQSGKPD